MKCSRISEIFIAEGLSWRHEETWFGDRVDPDFAKKRGAIETVSTAPPEGRVTVCLDQMGPVAGTRYPGQQLVAPQATESNPAERAKQEIDDGRREKAGYVFGALQPRTGEVLTATYTRRTLVNWIDFLHQVEEWLPKDVERVYAVLENLPRPRAVDVLLFNLAHPRWEFVFQPTSAASLNLIEPWWKTRKLAGPQRPTLRDLERDRGGGAEGNGLLECAQTSLRLGSTPTPSATQEARHCTAAKRGLNLPDAPLSLWGLR